MTGCGGGVDFRQGGVGDGVGHGFLAGGVQSDQHPLPPQLVLHPLPPPPQLYPHPPLFPQLLLPLPQPLPPPQLFPQLSLPLSGRATCWVACAPSVIAFAAVPVRSSVAPTATQPDITRIRVFITAPLL
jgi:hypothetical protein